MVTRVLLAAFAVVLPLLPFGAARLLFVREAVLLEGARPFESVGRSYRLVKRQLGSCLGMSFATLAVPAAFAVGAELLGDALVRVVLQLGRPFGQLFEQGGSGYALLGFFLAVPVTAAARFLKYIDVRTRKEGWDIQVRFTALAAADQPGGGRAGSNAA